MRLEAFVGTFLSLSGKFEDKSAGGIVVENLINNLWIKLNRLTGLKANQFKKIEILQYDSEKFIKFYLFRRRMSTGSKCSICYM